MSEKITVETVSQKIEEALKAYGYDVQRHGALAIGVNERGSNTRDTTIIVRMNGKVEFEIDGAGTKGLLKEKPIPKLKERVNDAVSGLKLDGEGKALVVVGYEAAK